VYAKALCLLLKALGGSEKSRLDIGGGSENSRFATAGTRNDVPLPSHTLVVALASPLVDCVVDDVLRRLDQVSMRRCFSWLTSVNSTSFSALLKQPVDATFRPSFVRKFCKQPASIVSFRQMQTFDHCLVFVAGRHCLQILQ